jgi:alpha-tubulin suppressor-like RCC1 family protein
MGLVHPRSSDGTATGVCSRRLRRALCASLALLAAASVLLVTAAAAPAEKQIEKPVNTTPPTIAGKAQEGVTLKAKEGKWSGGSIAYSFQWQRCEPELECTNIPLATTSEYTARYVDIGSSLRVLVTASNSAGTTELFTERTSAVVGVAPKNTELPVITGAAQEGQLLSVSSGAWTGTQASRYTYQWERCTTRKCSEIAGASVTSYRVAAADVGDTLRATVTYQNLAGSKSATSLQTALVTYGPPVPIGFPAVTGQLREGRTLQANTGRWVGLAPIEYSYSWEACNAEGSCTHASGSSFPLGAGTAGDTVRLTVVAHNGLGSASASSVATPRVLGEGENFAVGWGENARGQLGTIYRDGWEETPVLAEGESNIAAISTGGSFTLELHNDGTVTAAGAGFYGSIGYGGRKASWEQGKSHVTVSGLSEVAAISSGAEYSLALLDNGNVMAWGNNAYGTLGNGTGGFEKETGENQLVPKEVRALHGAGVTAIASGGGANFAILPGGRVMAWGHNNRGQLGIAWPAECEKRKTCEPNAKKPSEEPGKKEAEHLCWTEVGPEQCSKVPRPVTEGEGAGEREIEHVVQVSAGSESAYALLADGEVLSWGNDGKGQLGQTLEPGAHTAFTRPGRVMSSETEPLRHVVAISAAANHVLALLEGGRVVGWGDATNGSLGEAAGTCGHEHKSGNGTWPCDRYATPITALDNIHVTQVAAGYGFAAVLGSEGRVYTVGTNTYGELGVGPKCENEGGEMGYQGVCYSRTWNAVPGLEGVQAISAGLKDLTALVGAGSAPPLPTIGTEPGHLRVKLQWTLPGAETPNRLSQRVWEHPGANEVAEGEFEGEGSESEEGEEAGEPPLNTTLPVLRVIEYVEGEKKVIRGATAVGEILESSPGNWSGAQPLSYEYRWLRCKSGKCTVITPWVPGEEAKGEQLPLTEEDAGYQFEAQVAARHEGEARGIATSAPSEIVKAESEGRKVTAEYANVEGVDGFVFGQLNGKPLEPVQYEFKLSSEGGPKAEKNRTFLVAPSP